MMPRYFLFLLLLLLAGCGGGSSASAPPPAAVELAVAGVWTSSGGNDVVNVTATVTDAAGSPVSGKVEVRVNRVQSLPPAVTILTGTSDVNGRLTLPVTVGPYEQTTITAVAGTVTSNVLAVTPAGNAAAAALVVVPSSDGRYFVDCSHFDGVAAMDVTILYDSVAASGPSVERGTFAPDAIVASNTLTPGTLRIASLLPYPRTFSGEGILATFRFDTEIQAPPGTISSIQIQLLDVRGEPVPARTLLINSYE